VVYKVVLVLVNEEGKGSLPGLCVSRNYDCDCSCRIHEANENIASHRACENSRNLFSWN
jgi:hypothetical protein